MKQKTKRFLSLLLTVIMLVTAQGFTVLADTVNQSDAQNLSAGEETDSGQAVMPEGAAAPANPVHHCTKDGSDWSYIYFGSYPQSEVTDEETIAAIESKIVSGNDATPDADETEAEDAKTTGTDVDTVETVGTDVEVDGIKYRRISEEDCNNNYYFNEPANGGDPIAYRYFKWEPIKWRVLDKDDNGTLFVMADKALDCETYNDKHEDITWEDSTIRGWLNGSFYQTAFSEEEQSNITSWEVVNEDNPNYDIEGGNNTDDKVYLLSIGEMTNESYGFCSDAGSSASRQLQTSEYAYARGAERIRSNGYCSWRLRSPGKYTSNAAYVTNTGNVNTWGNSANGTGYGQGNSVVPVLHIDLSLWSEEDDASTPEKPVHHCTKEYDGTDCTDFSYVYFGSYPQSEVIDSATRAAIDSAIAKSGTTADAGIDVWVKGAKYRRLSEGDTNNGGKTFGNGQFRYFMWEPIKWRVLNNNDNGTLFVMADRTLDCKCYNDVYEDITWKDSTIRSWLNDSFYHTAFSSDEQDAIMQWDIVNEDNPEWGTDGGEDTKDYVYLLSFGEVTNEKYGLCSDYYTIQTKSRQLRASLYAFVRGAQLEDWWLRSPSITIKRAAYVEHVTSERAANVENFGHVDRYGYDVNDSSNGVVPALHIDLSSDLWSVVDDGTGGAGGGTSTGGNKNPSNPSKPNPSKPDSSKPDASKPDASKPDASKPADPQPVGTSLTASQVKSQSDTVPQGASFTITNSDPAEPTVCFDGVSDENAAVVAIPKTITYKGVEYKVTTVSPTAFSTKKDNASFTVTDNRVESLTAEYKAMSNAKKTKVTVPESVTYKGIKFKVTSVAAKSFKNNKKVKQVSIADSVTKIGDSAFEGCTSLKSVTLGKGTSTIGKNAFKNCKKLTKITIKSTKLKTVGKNALKGVNAKCKIKVPAKQLKKYQNLFKKKGQKNSVKLVK